MKNKTQLLLLGLSFVVLSGCTEKKEETYKTVAYYVKNPDIRDNRVSECKKMDEKTETIAKDCENAWRAVPKKLIDTSGWIK